MKEKKKKITREKLGIEHGEYTLVKGKISYSKVLKPYTEAELEIINKERKQKNQVPAQKTFTTITLINPVFVIENKLAEYHKQDIYINQYNRKAINVKAIGDPPEIVVYLKKNKNLKRVEIKNEIRLGTEVLVLIRAYKSKNYSNISSGMNLIQILNYENYFDGKVNKKEMKTLIDINKEEKFIS